MDKIFDIVDFDHNSELTATFKDFNYQLEDRSNQQQLTLSIENHNNNNNQDHQNDVNDERKQKEMFRIDSAAAATVAAKIKLKNNFSELGGDGGGGDNDRMMNNNNNNFIHKEEEEDDDEGDDDELEEIFDNILDDILFSVLLQVHRSAKLGYFLINNNSNNNLDSLPHQHQQISDYNHDDVLGFFSNKFDIMKPGASNNKTSQFCSSSSSSSSFNNGLMKYECVCPNCNRSLAAIRFAPHLEKCMGMGRSSSRLATRRIANYNIIDDLDQLIEADYLDSTKSASNFHQLSSAPGATADSLIDYNFSNLCKHQQQQPKKRKSSHQPANHLHKSASTALTKPYEQQQINDTNGSVFVKHQSTHVDYNSFHHHHPHNQNHQKNINVNVVVVNHEIDEDATEKSITTTTNHHHFTNEFTFEDDNAHNNNNNGCLFSEIINDDDAFGLGK